ncbi:MAG: sugar phosphate nucleotidyltransferase, partial [Desulfobacterales bacterium]
MPDWKQKVYPVLLAGGTGTRLWPVSRTRTPKQLVSFTGKDSLVQNTIERLIPLLDRENVRIVCGEAHVHETARQLAEINVSPAGKILGEPCGRNTAPAILLAVLRILRLEAEAVLCILPADHVIRKLETFHNHIQRAVSLAEMGHIVTFGIRPLYPETGYGYIEGVAEISDGARSIKRFVEKPDRATA